MKIRQGFVSNSSSSSFVLMVDKETHEQAIATLKKHKYFKALEQILKGAGKEHIFGRDLVVIEEYDSHGCGAVGGLTSEDFDSEEWRTITGIDLNEEDEYSQYEIREEVVDTIWGLYQSLIPDDKCCSASVDM